MSNLVVKENIEVMGIEIPNIHGGFGVNKKSILAKHIAEIHGKELKHVNEKINDNRKRFKDNIDIIDVKKDTKFVVALTDHNIFSKMQIAKANNIYLLSERGYAKLVKIFDDDKSWDLYDELLDEYFELRDGESNIMPMTQLELAQYSINLLVEQEKEMLLMKQKQDEIDNKVIHLETEFNKESVSEGYKTNDNIARHFGLYSVKNKPHFNFIDAIAKYLRIYNTTIGYKDEYVNVIRTTVHGGNVGAAVYYSDKAIDLIREFVANEFKPKASYIVQGIRKGQIKEIAFQLNNKTYKFNESTYKKYSS